MSPDTLSRIMAEWRHACWCLLALCAFARDARADESDAKALFSRGVEHSRAERWQEAHAAFSSSLEREQRVSTHFNLALVALKLERGRECLEHLGAFAGLADPAQHGDFLAEAATLRERALSLVGTLELTITPAHAEARLDDAALPLLGDERTLLRLDPGKHTLHVSAPGYHSLSQPLVIERALRQRLTLALTPVTPVAERRGRASDTPAQEDSGWHVPALWAGGALAAVGVGMLVFFLAKSDSEPYSGTSDILIR